MASEGRQCESGRVRGGCLWDLLFLDLGREQQALLVHAQGVVAVDETGRECPVID